jgi:hypothetical protein
MCRAQAVHQRRLPRLRAVGDQHLGRSADGGLEEVATCTVGVPVATSSSTSCARTTNVRMSTAMGRRVA